jgi:hypothetical protein
MSHRGLQQRGQLKTDFCEIFRTAQFSTFSTTSTRRRRRKSIHPNAQELDHLTPLLGFVGDELTEFGRGK